MRRGLPTSLQLTGAAGTEATLARASVPRTSNEPPTTGCALRDCDPRATRVISRHPSVVPKRSGVHVTTSMLPVSPAAFARAKWEDVAPYFDELAARSAGRGHHRELAAGLVHARGAGHRGRGAGDDRLHDRYLGPGKGSRSPPVLHRDHAEDGGAERRAGPAARRARATPRPRWPRPSGGSAPRSRSSARRTFRSSRSWRS